MSSLPDTYRTLPHSLDAEMGVLGSMLIAPATVVPMMIDGFDSGKFYQPAHKTIYTAIVARWRDNLATDPITITHDLREAGALDAIGGPSYVTILFTFTPTEANASYYREIVLEMAWLREIIGTCTAVASEAYNPGATGPELSERLQVLLTGLATEASTGSSVATAQDLANTFIDRLEARHAEKGKLRGISSGLTHLDRLTGGWQGGQMIVIAAPEKQGKSSLARQFALAAVLDREPTAILSHEMSRDEICDACIATLARVDSKRIQDGVLSDDDLQRIGVAAGKFSNAPLFVFDESDSSVLQFRANCRRAVRDHGCRLIVLDYLQLVAGSDTNENREQAISEVARNAKLAAKELNVPIIVLSQLNKEGVTQYARAVQMHLDKFIVIEHENPEAEGDGKAWIRLKLARGGPKGSVSVMWRPAFTCFDAIYS